MGNRAVIAYIPDHQEVPATYKDAVKAGVAGIYLHWNGGPESVAAFLRAAEHYGFRTDDYGLARLTQIIGNYFDGPDGLSVGVGPIQDLDCDNYDNGTYVVHKWEIVNRWFLPGLPESPQTFDPRKAVETYRAVRTSNDAVFRADSEDLPTVEFFESEAEQLQRLFLRQVLNIH